MCYSTTFIETLINPGINHIIEWLEGFYEPKNDMTGLRATYIGNLAMWIKKIRKSTMADGRYSLYPRQLTINRQRKCIFWKLESNTALKYSLMLVFHINIMFQDDRSNPQTQVHNYG